jgi:hypothetical protein
MYENFHGKSIYQTNKKSVRKILWVEFLNFSDGKTNYCVYFRLTSTKSRYDLIMLTA